MKGAYYCPHCKTPNACTCPTCRDSITPEDVVGQRHAEHITCGHCGKNFSYNEAMDTEWELYQKRLEKKTNEDS